MGPYKPAPAPGFSQLYLCLEADQECPFQAIRLAGLLGEEDTERRKPASISSSDSTLSTRLSSFVSLSVPDS